MALLQRHKAFVIGSSVNNSTVPPQIHILNAVGSHFPAVVGPWSLKQEVTWIHSIQRFVRSNAGKMHRRRPIKKLTMTYSHPGVSNRSDRSLNAMLSTWECLWSRSSSQWFVVTELKTLTCKLFPMMSNNTFASETINYLIAIISCLDGKRLQLFTNIRWFTTDVNKNVFVSNITFVFKECD